MAHFNRLRAQFNGEECAISLLIQSKSISSGCFLCLEECAAASPSFWQSPSRQTTQIKLYFFFKTYAIQFTLFQII
jgi:hypothetical protein